MIQFTNTSSAVTQNPPDNVLASSVNPGDANFQNALSAALAATLKEFGIDPSQVTLSFKGATPAVSPFSKSVTAALTNSNAGPVTSSAPPAPAAPGAAGSAGGSGGTSQDSGQSFDDAYWANQPAAVQALRSITDYVQRTKVAAQLAEQGYTIDVPIMVWGWDPAKITAARQSYGYTWVPSALQPNLAEAPGFNLPGVTAYDPTHPPAGSVAV